MSNVLEVSLSIDIIARFGRLSSVIVDLWNLLISLNLLKLRSAVIGKLSLEWTQAPFPLASAEIFPGGQRRHFSYTFQVADDAMRTDVHKAL